MHSDLDVMAVRVDEQFDYQALHAVGWPAVGLQDFGRPTGYLARQLRRWVEQWELRIVHHDGALFLWPDDLEPTAYCAFRLPGDSAEARREATDISPEEIANAAQHLLSQQISLPLDDLVRETASLFGYQRTGQRVEPAIRRDIALLLTCQTAREAGGMVIQPPQ